MVQHANCQQAEHGPICSTSGLYAGLYAGSPTTTEYGCPHRTEDIHATCLCQTERTTPFTLTPETAKMP